MEILVHSISPNVNQMFQDHLVHGGAEHNTPPKLSFYASSDGETYLNRRSSAHRSESSSGAAADFLRCFYTGLSYDVTLFSVQIQVHR